MARTIRDLSLSVFLLAVVALIVYAIILAQQVAVELRQANLANISMQKQLFEAAQGSREVTNEIGFLVAAHFLDSQKMITHGEANEIAQEAARNVSKFAPRWGKLLQHVENQLENNSGVEVDLRRPPAPAGPGLQLAKIVPTRTAEGLVVEGDIINSVSAARDVPRLRVALRDPAEKETQFKIIDPPTPRLGPGETAHFKTSFDHPDEAATGVLVTFTSARN